MGSWLLDQMPNKFILQSCRWNVLVNLDRNLHNLIDLENAIS